MATMNYQTEDRLSRTTKRTRSNYGDELFTSPQPRKFTGAGSPDIGIVNIADLRDIRAKTILGKKNDAAIIHQDDLSRIKETMKIKTAAQAIEEKKMTQTMLDQKRMFATERKAKMQQLDQVRTMKEKPSMLSLEQRQRKEGLLSRAQMMLDEQLDDVKHMNQMCFYSKVVTVRDKQLIESKQLEKEWVEEQKKLDIMMEIERLKGLNEEQIRESRRADARKRGAQVIIDQIGERHQERINDQEVRAKERIMMRMNMDEQDRLEKEQQMARSKKLRDMSFQVKVANDLSKTIKDEAAQKERQEYANIHQYNLEKQQREYEVQEEARMIREEKEKEIQKLREMQEKAADRQADIDALRAKRAFEEGERNARKREVLENEKRVRLLAEMEVARATQFAEREQNLQNQITTEKESFLRVLQEQKDLSEREKMIGQQRQKAFHSHKNDILVQIQSKSDLKKQERQDYLEEGRKLRLAKADEILKLETIKTNKLHGLQGMGINQKYLSELERKKVAY